MNNSNSNSSTQPAIALANPKPVSIGMVPAYVLRILLAIFKDEDGSRLFTPLDSEDSPFKRRFVFVYKIGEYYFLNFINKYERDLAFKILTKGAWTVQIVDEIQEMSLLKIVVKHLSGLDNDEVFAASTRNMFMALQPGAKKNFLDGKFPFLSSMTVINALKYPMADLSGALRKKLSEQRANSYQGAIQATGA